MNAKNCDPSALARRLYQRRSEAVDVPFSPRSLPNWTPDEQECHRNSDVWALHNPLNPAIRGWIVFDFTIMQGLGLKPFFRFNAHSVNQDSQGNLFDLTPSQASRRYPFLHHDGSEGDFIALVTEHNITVVNHFL